MAECRRERRQREVSNALLVGERSLESDDARIGRAR